MKKAIRHKDQFIVKFSSISKIEASDYVLKDVEFLGKEGIDFLNITISLQRKGERNKIKMFTCTSKKCNKEMLKKAADSFVLADYLSNRQRSSACRNAAKKMVEPLHAMLMEFYEMQAQYEGL